MDADPIQLIDAGAAGGFDAVGLRIVLPVGADPIVEVVGDVPLQRRIKERLAATARLQAQFDLKLRTLYGQVADEYPGERKVKARPLTDPR